MEVNPSKMSALVLTQASIPNNADPNVTLSDDSGEINDISKEATEKRKVRWTKKEQKSFLQHLVNSESDLKYLQKQFPSRTLQDIKDHTRLFINKCKKEFSVSKTKQQNKSILKQICLQYAIHPLDIFLNKLEEVVLDPAFDEQIDLENNEKESHLSIKGKKGFIHQKKPRNNKAILQTAKASKPKTKIFHIAKIKRNTKVYNILNINVLLEDKKKPNNRSNLNGFNPFNLEFDSEILNTNSNNINNNTSIYQSKNYHEDIEINQLISNNKINNNLNSSINDDYESMN